MEQSYTDAEALLDFFKKDGRLLWELHIEGSYATDCIIDKITVQLQQWSEPLL